MAWLSTDYIVCHSVDWNVPLIGSQTSMRTKNNAKVFATTGRLVHWPLPLPNEQIERVCGYQVPEGIEILINFNLFKSSSTTWVMSSTLKFAFPQA